MPSAEERQRRRDLLRTLEEQRQAAIDVWKRRHAERRFFVLRHNTDMCQVQVLNWNGSARAAVDYADASAPLMVDSELVPVEVLEAGLRRTTFDGDYVNERGESVPPF